MDAERWVKISTENTSAGGRSPEYPNEDGAKIVGKLTNLVKNYH